MSTLTRKQREMLEREQRILDFARSVIVQEGYHGLNMEGIAENLEYSKGTIYNHFSCKEEIIIALANQTIEKRTSMFERGAAFRGSSRQRIQAVGTAASLFLRLYPDHFVLEQIIRSSSIWEKTSEKRRLVMRSCETRCMGIVGGVVRDAIAQSDLELEPGVAPEEIVFGLWSISVGAFSIITTSDQLVDLGIKDPFAAYQKNVEKMLDGLGWLPLSVDFDYEGTLARIQEEVFPDEFRAIAA